MKPLFLHLLPDDDANAHAEPSRLDGDPGAGGEPVDRLLQRLQDLVFAIGMVCIVGLLFAPPL
jgi:hypothetical protein